MKWLSRLYPRAWRDRYRDELTALLEGRRPSVRDAIDLVGGIIDAWQHPHLLEGHGDGRGRMCVSPRAMSQVAGLALILSPAMLPVGMALSGQGPDEELPFRIWKTLTYAVVPTLVVLGLVGVWLRAWCCGQFHLAGRTVFCASVVAWLAVELGVAVWASSPLGEFPSTMSDVLVVGLVALVVSYGATGLIAARERLLPLWSAVPPVIALVAGAISVAAVAGYRSGLAPDWETGMAVGLFLALLVLSWIGLGLGLFVGAQDEPEARTPSTV